MGAGVNDSSRRATWAMWLGFAALYALHLWLLGRYLSWEMATGPDAISGMGDFATHMNQTTRVLEGLEGWGEGWVYDPFLLAGHPTGTIFDADNKGWEIFAWLGTKIGWSVEEGHTRFIVLTHLSVPGLIFFAAWCLRLVPAARLVAVALGIGLWYFDSFSHWCWWAGMVAYDLGAVFFLVPLVTFWRYLESRRVGWALVCGLSLGLAHLIHPYVFFMLAPGMLVWFWRAWPSLDRKGRAWVFAIAGITLAMNAWWLLNAARFWHYILDSAYYGQSGLPFLFADYASLLLNPETSGLLGTRTGFRFLAWGLGLVGLWLWTQRGDSRAPGLRVSLGGMLVLAYLGGYLSATQQIQPYRFVLPAAFLAVLPAASFAVEGVAALRERGWRTPASLLTLVLLLPAGQQLTRDITYFMPEQLPAVAKTVDGQASPIGADGYITPNAFRYGLIMPDEALIDWVREHDDGQSRWLVQISFYGEELAWQTKAQVLGGFTHRNVGHSWANFFRRRPQGIATPAELRAYFETYAVGWVVVPEPNHWLWKVPNPELELVTTVGWTKIFKTKIQPQLIEAGGGRVEVDTNSLRVRGSDPRARVRLRFHWMETLRCRPDCRIERGEIDGVDPVGFIEIPAPHPADFEVYNAYEFGGE